MKKLLFLFFSFLCTAQLMSNDLTWTSPTTLSTALVNASDPQMTMDPNGNATSAWVENGVIIASYQPVGGSWGTSATLSASGSSNPRLGADSSGNVTAIWISGGQVFSSTLPSGGSWGAATLVSSVGVFGITQAELSVRSNGDVVAIWARGGYIEASTKLFGGSWSLVSALSVANSDNPSVSVGANGTVVALWHSDGISGNIIMSSLQSTIGGSWTTAKAIIPLSTAFVQNYPKVSVDALGNADAICLRYQVDGSEFINLEVFASSLPLNAAAWSALPTQLSTNPGIRNPADLRLSIVHDTAGNALAFWSMSYDDSTFTLESALKLFGNAWTSNFTLVNTPYSFQGDVCANSLGDVVGAYMYFDGTSATIQAAESNIGGTLESIFWSPAIGISTGPNNGYSRVASTYLSGTVFAAAAWLSSDGTTTSVQVATGSRATLAPPTSLSVVQNSANYGVFTDYYNTVSWTASTDPNVVGYAIYRNGVLFDRVNPITYSIVEHNVIQNGAVTYGVAAIDNESSQSETVNINYP